ncbi:hypothetical protein GCM10022248_15160 [Nonomuraea soli]
MCGGTDGRRARDEHATRGPARYCALLTIRTIGERAVAKVKTWKILDRVRCCLHRITMLVQAILALGKVESCYHSG